MISDKMLPVSITAKRLGVSPKTVRRYIEQGDITAINMSTGTRPTYNIAESEITKFMEKRKTSLYYDIDL